MESSRGEGESETAERMSEGHEKRTMTRNALRITWGLSVLAVALSALALGVAVLAPRPAPGSFTVHESRGGPVTIGASCTHYPGAEVSLSPPGPGTVVVSATVGVGINHTFGIDDEARIVVASGPTDCTLDNFTAFVSVPRALATSSFYFETVPILRPFPIRVAGPYTFYVNGVIASGWDPIDRFDSASLVATFYPA